MFEEEVLLTVKDRFSLIQVAKRIQRAACGLPVVLSWLGPLAVIWPPDYPSLTLELPCCVVHLEGPDALPGEDVKCPHGRYLIRYQ